MACALHKHKRKGQCTSVLCSGCICCPPGPSCEVPRSHIKPRDGGNSKRKNCSPSVLPRSSPLTRVLRVRGEHRINLAEVDGDDDSDECWYFSDDEACDEGYDSNDSDGHWHFSDYKGYDSDEEGNNIMDMIQYGIEDASLKTILLEVFKLLQVPMVNDNVIDQISSRGDHNLMRGKRVQQRIFRIVNAINTALFDLLCIPKDAGKVKERFFLYAANNMTNKVISRHERLVENVLTLGFHGNLSTSIIALSALAKTFS